MINENILLVLKKKDMTIKKLQKEIQKLKNRQPHHDEQTRKEHQQQMEFYERIIGDNMELREQVRELRQQLNIPEVLRGYSPEDIEDLKNGYEFFKELKTFFGQRFEEEY